MIGELEALYQKRLIIGTDEAGRGPLAGPVIAAAVCLGEFRHEKLNDSKKLKKQDRDFLFDVIRDNCVSYKIIAKSNEYIDLHNIRQASLDAMKEACEFVFQKLEPQTKNVVVLVDGKDRFPFSIPDIEVAPCIKGDARSWNIAAASILAKVCRDRFMMEMEKVYPEYGFSQHKGYPTKKHKQMILSKGPCEIHRKTFKGVSEFITKGFND